MHTIKLKERKVPQYSCVQFIKFRKINFRGIRGFWLFHKNLSAQIFFLFFYPKKINP